MNAKPPIEVTNAGLVIVSSFLALLFSRCELTKDDAFIDDLHQERAMLVAQYLAFGDEVRASSESFALNNLLCGRRLQAAPTSASTLTRSEHELADELLRAVLSHWRQLGNISLAGLRESFLQREGTLLRTDSGYELRVQRKTLDLLLDQSPFSFRIVKFPWMRQPLHVTW